MTPEQRTKLIRRLCLFAPLLSAASIAVLALTPLDGYFVRASQSISPALAGFASVAPVLGWFLLTITCSAVTALDLLKLRRAKSSATSFVMMSLIGTVVVFFAHVLVIGTIAFAGCVVAMNGALSPRSR